MSQAAPDPDLLNCVYRAFLDVLPLRERERRVHLDGRGLPAEELQEHIDRRRYRSLPRIGRSKIVRRIMDRGISREELLQVPGFIEVRNRQGSYLTIKGPDADALVVPVEDIAGRVVGLRLRVVRADGRKVYLYFRGAQARVHVGCPRALTDSASVLVSEGEIKVNIGADRLGMVCLSQPGAGECIEETVAIAKTFGRRVVMAYDPDKRDPKKPQVRNGEHRTARALRDAGLQVMEAAWPAELGKIDDLLVAGHMPEIHPYPFPESRVEPISRERLDAMLPSEPKTMSLADARYETGMEFRRVVEAGVPGQTVIVGPPGLGKSVTVCLALQDMFLSGALDGRRVLYLPDTHEQIQGLLENPLLVDLAIHSAVWEGRSPNPRSKAYCPDKDPEKGKDISSRLAGNRHGIMGSLCRTKDSDWACTFSDSCPYLETVQRLAKAQIVFAPKACFQASPEELGKFDVIIVDEDLVGALFDHVLIRRSAVDDWSAGVARLDAEAQRRARCPELLRDLDGDSEDVVWAPDARVARWPVLLRRVHLTSLPRNPEEWRPFMPALRQAAADLGDDLHAIVQAVAAIPIDRLRRLPFERPFIEGDVRTIPLRANADLVPAVQREIDRPDDADSCLRLTHEGLILLAVRERHVELLRERTVINLDATPCTPLLRLVFPEHRTVPLAVPQHVMIAQATNALYTRDYVHANRWWIDRLLDAVTFDELRPTILTYMDYDPDAGLQQARRGRKGALRAWRREQAERIECGVALQVSNPAVLYGHFAGSTRGVDAYRESTLLIVLGDYVDSIGSLEARIRSVRATLGMPRPPQRLEGDVLLPYRWRAADGSGIGRRFRRHPDTDVAALIEWSRTSAIIQAMGRGRAALRSAEAPLRILLLASWPGHGLPVARLLGRPELMALAGIPEGETRSNLDETNERRRREFRSQVLRAVSRIHDSRREITVMSVAREMGVGDGGRQLATIAQLLTSLHIPLRRGPVSLRSSIYTEGTSETAPSRSRSHDDHAGSDASPDPVTSDYDQPPPSEWIYTPARPSMTLDQARDPNSPRPQPRSRRGVGTSVCEYDGDDPPETQASSSPLAGRLDLASAWAVHVGDRVPLTPPDPDRLDDMRERSAAIAFDGREGLLVGDLAAVAGGAGIDWGEAIAAARDFVGDRESDLVHRFRVDVPETIRLSCMTDPDSRVAAAREWFRVVALTIGIHVDREAG